MTTHGPYSAGEARSYDSDRESEPLWHQENAWLARLVKDASFGSVLDVPVGTGRFLEVYPDVRVVGVDLSDAMLEQAARKASTTTLRDVTLLKASVTSLPFRDAEFDLVVCWRLLHLLPPQDLRAAFAELRRVCAGTLCVQVYAQAPASERAKAWAWRWVRRLRLLSGSARQLTPWSHITAYAHSSRAIEAAAAAAGLGPAKSEYIASYEGTHVLAMTWKVAA